MSKLKPHHFCSGIARMLLMAIRCWNTGTREAINTKALSAPSCALVPYHC